MNREGIEFLLAGHRFAEDRVGADTPCIIGDLDQISAVLCDYAAQFGVNLRDRDVLATVMLGLTVPSAVLALFEERAGDDVTPEMYGAAAGGGLRALGMMLDDLTKSPDPKENH